MNEKIRKRAKQVMQPQLIGSYKQEDCIFLLKNLNGVMLEQGNEERELKNQKGVHYSEMLPVEYEPSAEYIDLFHKSLNEISLKLAEYVAIVSETILNYYGNQVILCSLARAGSPIGVLVKRYLKQKHNIDAPHYSISIIRGKGFDENALCYILDKHNSDNVAFIDGWTGKGAIQEVLEQSCEDFNGKYDVNLQPILSVLADPAHCAKICGTREDFLIPSACLNSTVSGLTTRSVERKDLIGEFDFHGAKYYDHWLDIDLSNYYVDVISNHFGSLETPDDSLCQLQKETPNSGLTEVMRILEEFNISSKHLCKPSVGECTRVLLRRVPWKILVNDFNNPYIQHVLMLAEARNVPVEEYKDMSYSCCGLIKNMTGEE